MDTALGQVWQLLNPALAVLVYYLVFGLLLGVTRGVEYFIPFLAIGVLSYQFTQRSVTQAASSLSGNSGLMRSIRFPRAMLPLTTVVTETLAYLPGVAVFVAVVLVAGVPVSLTWILLPLLIVLQFVFNVGAALVVARLSYDVRDVKNVLPFVFRLLFYGSGVIFNVNAYLDDDRLKWLFTANPLFSLLALYRWSLLGMEADPWELTSVVIWAVVLVVGGLWWFRRGEARYGH